MKNLESNEGYCPVFRRPKILHFSRDFVTGTFGEEGKRSWSHTANLSFFAVAWLPPILKILRNLVIYSRFIFSVRPYF